MYILAALKQHSIFYMIREPYNIYFDSNDNCVIMDWDGYSTSVQFQEGTELMLSLVKSNQSRMVLADMKDMVLISMEDQHWVVNSFLPKLSEAGVEKVAIVNPHYYYGKVAIESLTIKANEASLQCKVFHNLETAKSWMKEAV